MEKATNESKLKQELIELGDSIKDKQKKSFKKLLQQEFGEGWQDE